MEPSLSQVIIFVHQFTRCGLSALGEDTYLEADLGITGDDGVELLEAIEKAFRVSFSTPERTFSETFSLEANEYLFSAEGLDLLGFCRFCDWVRGIPRPVIRDLTPRQLQQALAKASSVHDLEVKE